MPSCQFSRLGFAGWLTDWYMDRRRLGNHLDPHNPHSTAEYLRARPRGEGLGTLAARKLR